MRSLGATPRNIETRVEEILSAEGQCIVIAGRELLVSPQHDAQSLAASFRRAVTQRFLHRRPNATEYTWNRFEKMLRAQLADKTKIDAETLPGILFLIDGL